MKLKLKNVEREFEATAPTERGVSGTDGQGNVKKYWIAAFSVKEALSTDEVEEYFAGDNLTELTFTTELVNGTEHSFILSGYEERIFSPIRYAEDGSCTVEIQLKKEAASV